MHLLEQTIILSFLSFDLYKLFRPSLGNIFKNLSNIDSKFHSLILRLQKVNLYLMAVEDPKALEQISPELIELGKHLIIKRIESQKVYMEKLSFMVNLIKQGDSARVRMFTVISYVRSCIEVSILSLNIYNKSVFVTKMEESSLKLKSIVINKPKLCEVEFPFVVVFDGDSVSMILCISRGLSDIKSLFLSEHVSKEKAANKKSQRSNQSPHELLKPKEKKPSPKPPLNIRTKKSEAKVPSQKEIPEVANLRSEDLSKKEELKKKQMLNVLIIKKEDMLSSLNGLSGTFHNQTDMLKLFVVKKRVKPEKVLGGSKLTKKGEEKLHPREQLLVATRSAQSGAQYLLVFAEQPAKSTHEREQSEPRDSVYEPGQDEYLPGRVQCLVSQHRSQRIDARDA